MYSIEAFAMPEDDPIQNDVRKRAWKQRFGPKPVCVLCRFDQPEGLTLVSWSMIDVQHVHGAKHDPDLKVPICRNCHARITELNRQAGASMTEPANLLEHLLTVLRALGAFFRLLGEALLKLAEKLYYFILSLTESYPGWHEMEAAK